MSQVSNKSGTGGPIPGTYVETITGNSGVATAVSNNIDLVAAAGSGTFVGSGNTVTYTQSGALSDSFVTDAGTAIPAAGVLDINGAHNVNTTASGHQVIVHGNNTITVGDLASVAGSDAITVTTGNISITAGNLNLPNTNTAGTAGVINFGGAPMLSNFGTDNIFLAGSGNTTTTSSTNVGIGLDALHLVTTGSGNVAIGESSLNICTTAGPNIAMGFASLSFLASGEYNIALGYNSGSAYTGAESSNIILGTNPGVVGESNVMRLGKTGTSNGEVNTAYIAGTYGVTPTVSGTNQMVISNDQGQLGTQTIPTPGGTSVAFLATQLSDQTNVTGDGTIYSVTFTDVISNVGSGFDGTSTFTAPSTGIYLLGFTEALSSGSSFAAQTNSVISIVTTATEYRFQQYNLAVYQPNNANAVQINGCVMADMTAGDTAFVYLRVLGGAKDVSVAGSTAYGWRTPTFYGYKVV